MTEPAGVIDPALTPAPLRILALRDETHQERTFDLAWSGEAAAGQFFMLGLPRVGEAPISVSTCGQGVLQVTIRKVGRVTEALFGLRAGDALQARGPYGHGWPEASIAAGQVIIAAGGSGLAPVRGLIRRLLARNPRPELDLLLGFRTAEDILFADEIRTWSASARVLLTVDRPAPDWTGRSGVITTLVPAVDLRPGPRTVIVVGPPLMMKFTAKAFLDRGVPPEEILVSYERRMSCGVGRCGHCRIHDAYVCLDGPVLPYPAARRLHD